MPNPRNQLFLALLALIVFYASPARAQDPSPGAFFDRQVYVGQDNNFNPVYYLNYFSYYTYDPQDYHYVYKYNFGYLYYFSGTDGVEDTDAYFYDFVSDDYFYTSPSLYPYIYSFYFGSYLYYFEDSSPREFYNFRSGSYLYY